MTSFQSPENRARNVAQPGEAVVWTGRAPTGVKFRALDLFVIPFALVWSGVPTSILAGALLSGTFSPAEAPLLLFFFGGVYLLFGRFWIDMKMRADTSYTLTDRAAYVARTGWFPAVRRYSGSTLDSIELRPKPDGSGTILFSANASAFSWMGNRNGQLVTPMLDRFDSVPDVQRVYGLVLAAAKPAR